MSSGSGVVSLSVGRKKAHQRPVATSRKGDNRPSCNGRSSIVASGGELATGEIVRQEKVLVGATDYVEECNGMGTCRRKPEVE